MEMTFSFIPGGTVEQIVLFILLGRVLFSPESDAYVHWERLVQGPLGNTSKDY